MPLASLFAIHDTRWFRPLSNRIPDWRCSVTLSGRFSRPWHAPDSLARCEPCNLLLFPCIPSSRQCLNSQAPGPVHGQVADRSGT